MLYHYKGPIVIFFSACLFQETVLDTHCMERCIETGYHFYIFKV